MTGSEKKNIRRQEKYPERTKVRKEAGFQGLGGSPPSLTIFKKMVKVGRFRRYLKRRKYARIGKAYQNVKRQRRATVVNRTRVTSGLGFPKQNKMTHKYATSVTMTTTAGAYTTYVFSANGMYDPDITGTGHQPLYFDQMAGVYNHYTVIGSKISISVTPGSALSTPFLITLMQDDDTTPAGTASEAIEQSNGRLVTLAAGSTNPARLRRKWSAKKTFGGNIMSNVNLKGTSTANPTEQSYYHIGIKPADGSSAVTFHVTLVIEYIAIWAELRTIASS